MSACYEADGFEVFAQAKNQWHQNSYFLIDSLQSSCIAIDPGFGLASFYEVLQRRKLTIKYILATHTHFDHIAGIADLQKEFGDPPFYCHEKDHKILQQANIYTMFLKEKRIELPVPSGKLCEAQPLSFGRGSLRVLHVPGHTPGGCLILFRNLVFSGDTLLRPSAKLRRLPGANAEDLAHSLAKIFGQVPMESLVFPGHGGVRSLRELKMALALSEAEQSILKPQAATDD
ncbi:MAG: MBL fold metallo-hydrolase [Proteobacteria bacterium]|nr:MBL fold metallo-hydrolase [Pseudomonadota bacterium]